MTHEPIPTNAPAIVNPALIAEFETNFEKSLGCWEWLGRRNKDDYGIFPVPVEDREFNFHGSRIDNRAAHRTSFRIYKGTIPIRYMVRHSCDHPWCVNYEHLLTGTARDNWDDMISRGRALGQPTDARSRCGQLFRLLSPTNSQRT